MGHWLNRLTGDPSSSPQSAPVHRWIVLAVCAMLLICSMFYRVSIAVIAPQLQLDLALSSEELGILSATFFYVFALAQLPLGFCLDRLGPRLTVTVLSLIGSVGAWVFSAANGLEWGMLGRSLLGLGMAANLMGPMKLFARRYSLRKFATLSGLLLSLGALGSMLAATPFALLVNALGWRWSFRIIGCLTAGVTLLFFVLLSYAPEGIKESRPNHPEDKRRISMARAVRALLTQREYWLISFSCFLRFGSFVAIQALWAGPYLMDVLQFSPVEAGNILLLVNFGVIVGSPMGGWLSDRVFCSRKQVVVLGMVSLALAELALVLGWGSKHVWVLSGLFFLLGTSSSFGIVSYVHIKEVMPEEMTGMALTGVNFFLMLGGAVFLQVMGRVIDFYAAGANLGPHAYQAAFFLGFLGVVLALGLYLFAKDAPWLGAVSKTGLEVGIEGL